MAGIPVEAEFSAWGYPSEDAIPPSSMVTDNAYFASMGGVVYFDRTRTKIVRAAASRPLHGGDLAFGQALPWGRAWTDPLIKGGRFHKVTDPQIRKAGALYYAWLGENEEVGNGV